MIPVVTPEEMGAIDRAAPEPVDVLIDRAGAAVARAALTMLGGAYGRRVVCVQGKGNNGNDGRAAVRRLRARGVRCIEVDALAAPERLPSCDLVIDAAFGTGFRGAYRAPWVHPGTPVLAVDIPSGVDGTTGAVHGAPEHVLTANRTVTFAALKPGLLLHPGAEHAGTITVADIGLDCSSATMHLIEARDVAHGYPLRPADAHKWQSAVWTIGGSAGLEGAAVLTARAALRAGAGYVRWSSLGAVPARDKPVEVVATALPPAGWAEAVAADAGRFRCLTIGNGLGLDAGAAEADELLQVLRSVDRPIVVDADALTLLGPRLVGLGRPNVVLTPHDGEFARIAGHAPPADRAAAVRDLAHTTGAIVLSKGPTTIVAHPDGRVRFVDAVDARLATLGTGDVLAGVIAAVVSRGVEPFEAAALAAFIHGRAGALGWRNGMVAGDLVDNLPAALDELVPRPPVRI